MKATPLVSIIIPVYNRADIVGETLLSIQKQTYEYWECIVIDDGSTDTTMDVVSAFAKADSRITLHKRPDALPKGANACRNYGFSISSGTYVNWFDSDDLMVATKLEKQLASIRTTNTVFNVCQTMVFDHATKKELGLRSQHIISEDFFNDFIVDKIKWLTQAPLIESSFIKTHKITFDEQLHRSQERDFFIKILAVLEKYATIDEPLVYLRKHDNSISYGKRTDTKDSSTFQVNWNTYVKHSAALTDQTKKYLIKLMKHGIREQIIIKNFTLARKFYKALLESKAPLSVGYKLKVQLAFCTYFLCNKGYFLLKDE
ncbi:glycosyltransferase family A protein [uncultured Dokdonia sp.]|uniref:glycosyltransferase family 2 protein n=1 Tax=uncultured Dokdonia sp. TaxID=575653 RepID=UPI002626F2B7|nr:glycosyltransferase family A protein [uncultured Dokdonia sp.]